MVWGWGTNAPVETYNLFYSQGVGNYACFQNASTDAYLDEALARPQVEDSFELWRKAQWDGAEGFAPQGDAPWVWLATSITSTSRGRALRWPSKSRTPTVMAGRL